MPAAGLCPDKDGHVSISHAGHGGDWISTIGVYVDIPRWIIDEIDTNHKRYYEIRYYLNDLMEKGIKELDPKKQGLAHSYLQRVDH